MGVATFLPVTQQFSKLLAEPIVIAKRLVFARPSLPSAY
jgi:hypothetical protein